MRFGALTTGDFAVVRKKIMKEGKNESIKEELRSIASKIRKLSAARHQDQELQKLETQQTKLLGLNDPVRNVKENVKSQLFSKTDQRLV